MILDGSYARGDNDEYSDMDIMVLFDCSYEEVIGYRKEISNIASRVGLENDILVSIAFRDFFHLRKVMIFYQNVIKEGHFFMERITKSVPFLFLIEQRQKSLILS